MLIKDVDVVSRILLNRLEFSVALLPDQVFYQGLIFKKRKGVCSIILRIA